MISFDSKICANLDEALGREWLETNGLGGFASSTIAGANTRRYHGLLVAATTPPAGRFLLLSKLEETLVLSGQRCDLATNEYVNAVHPRGLTYLTGFRLDPFPVFTFYAGGAQLEKAVFMLHGQNTTVVTYRLLLAPAGQEVSLELRPLIAFRDYHATTHENQALDSRVEDAAGAVSVAPYPGLPRLYLAHNASAVEKTGYWYRNFFYRVEEERGLDSTEDLFNPLTLRFVLPPGGEAVVIASTEPQDTSRAAEYRLAEKNRREAIRASVAVRTEVTEQLALAADQFLVRRAPGTTVIAGYPWFTDWGRDTMIALPGLTLFTGKATVAKEILRTFAAHVDQGMLPNRFPDQAGAAEYNTADATLWFFEALRVYVAVTDDFAFVEGELYPVLTSIVDWHIRGTRYGIRVNDNGLLNAGVPGLQLTWMDAKYGDWVITPRIGQPVEIQALWFNALKIIEGLAARLGDETARSRYAALAASAQRSFQRLFWNDKAGCLYDVVHEGQADDSIRPNQIFAVSLPHTMLARDRARSVVGVVERELLTPFGLRTLNPSHPAYQPRYQGNPRQRDAAYHQGTVWPWLLGPFISAYLKVNGGSGKARQRAKQMLEPLTGQLTHAGLGQISEIYDGSEPQLPRGCFAQAWSVAEILRVLTHEIE